MRSSLLDDIPSYWKVHRKTDELLSGPLSLCKKCPHVQKTMPMFQNDKHTVHFVLGSVSSNSHNSMLRTSWIICFDCGLKGLNDWFCRRSCWRACRSGWFSILWINCRTLVLCACFTTECGSPGIRKSMSASFTILSWEERTPELSFASAVLKVATGRPVLSRVCSTLKLFLSSDVGVGITFVSTGRHRSLENGTCFFHLAYYQVAQIFHEMDLELLGSIGNF